MNPLVFVLSVLSSSGQRNESAPPSAAAISQKLAALVNGFPGRVGISVRYNGVSLSLKGSDAYPLQSVAKLVLAAAVLDKVDHHQLSLPLKIFVRQANLSVGHQPLAALVGVKGYTIELGDIIRRAIVDSDNAAADILFVKAGGPQGVAAFLKQKGIKGIRVDRRERDLQTELAGLRFEPSYFAEAAFEKAVASVPKARRDAAWKAGLNDPRDTATPEGMTALLTALSSGKLLSPASTKVLLDDMRATATGNDRLAAGLSPGWTLAHKSGTSGRWNGIEEGFNDVGILTRPNGWTVSVAVFISGSPAPDARCAALIAGVAKTVIEGLR